MMKKRSMLAAFLVLSVILLNTSLAPAVREKVRNESGCFAFGVVNFLAASLRVQEKEAKVIFLNLVWEKGNIVLKDYAIRMGRVKQSIDVRISKDVLAYALLSDNNSKIGDGLFSNPSIERLEYSDPENPGKIKLVLTKRDTATFTLRLPYTQNLARVDFFMLKDAVQKPSKKLGEALESLKGDKIGSVVLKSAKRR